uniref:Uncharacterized protein n=1 Tax=Vespula pensylvanica TaxID=30213 RepID=A0A834P958_VESPE|nr:hypothetical protein H0235_005321 [Vespula pensylvanica]
MTDNDIKFVFESPCRALRLTSDNHDDDDDERFIVVRNDDTKFPIELRIYLDVGGTPKTINPELLLRFTFVSLFRAICLGPEGFRRTSLNLLRSTAIGKIPRDHLEHIELPETRSGTTVYRWSITTVLRPIAYDGVGT